MPFHYVSNGVQCGPVSDTQLEQLIRNGQINRDTLVWQEGMADWQALAAVRPDLLSSGAPTPAISSAPPLIPRSTCAECGRAFPPDELIMLNNSRVCAQCKPVFLQRMAEGVPAAGSAGIWRQGKRVVTRSETPFPDRCVKCNAPANGFRLKRVLYWQHPAYYLLLLCNILVLLIVVMIVRKKAILHIGLCAQHRKQRVQAIIACLVGLFGGAAMIIGGAVMRSGWLALAGVVIFLTGAVWGALKGTTLTAVKIDKEFVWLSGAGKSFLAELPERGA
jgi:hypothetical protein